MSCCKVFIRAFLEVFKTFNKLSISVEGKVVSNKEELEAILYLTNLEKVLLKGFKIIFIRVS